MLFNSALFLLVFFPIVTVAYYALPHRFRIWLLLAASAYFYAVAIPTYQHSRRSPLRLPAGG